MKERECAYEKGKDAPPPGSAPIYGLHRFALQDRAWLLKFYHLCYAPRPVAFPVLSSDRVPNLYQLKLHCVNVQLSEIQMICLKYPQFYKDLCFVLNGYSLFGLSCNACYNKC